MDKNHFNGTVDGAPDAVIEPDLVEPTSPFLRRPLRKLSDVIKANGERVDFPPHRRRDPTGAPPRPMVAEGFSDFADRGWNFATVERLLHIGAELRLLNHHQLSTLAVTLSRFSRANGCFVTYNFLTHLQTWGERMGAQVPPSRLPDYGYAADTDEDDQARS